VPRGAVIRADLRDEGSARVSRIFSGRDVKYGENRRENLNNRDDDYREKERERGLCRQTRDGNLCWLKSVHSVERFKIARAE